MALQFANGKDMDIIKNFICCPVFTESLTKFGSHHTRTTASPNNNSENLHNRQGLGPGL